MPCLAPSLIVIAQSSSSGCHSNRNSLIPLGLSLGSLMAQPQPQTRPRRCCCQDTEALHHITFPTCVGDHGAACFSDFRISESFLKRLCFDALWRWQSLADSRSVLAAARESRRDWTFSCRRNCQLSPPDLDLVRVLHNLSPQAASQAVYKLFR